MKYIAEVIPDEDAGGRLGNNLYIDLENDVSVHLGLSPLLIISSF